jgi:hypothetical protein
LDGKGDVGAIELLHDSTHLGSQSRARRTNTEAKKAIAQVRELDAALLMADLKDWIPFRRPEDLERLKEGLRKAGLPVT